jgi:hypothetical protein
MYQRAWKCSAYRLYAFGWAKTQAQKTRRNGSFPIKPFQHSVAVIQAMVIIVRNIGYAYYDPVDGSSY